MQMPEKKKVHYSSPEAAKLTTVEGWLSADGTFWPSSRADAEHMARYCGSTHQKCRDCDTDVPRGSVRCDACAERQADERYAGLERKPWEGKSYVAIFDGDTYFDDFDSLCWHVADNPGCLDSLQLVHCTPNYASQVDAADHFSDDLPEDGDVPDELDKAVDALNAVIHKHGPLSWSPSKVAVELSAEQIETLKQLEKGNVDPQ